MSGLIRYSIDGVFFSDYSIRVSKSSGLIDPLKQKDRFSRSFQDSPGIYTDTRKSTVGERVIELECFVVADTPADLHSKLSAVTGLFQKSGYLRLMVEIGNIKPLVYDVYCSNITPYKFKWKSGRNVATFTVTLVDPMPTKRVYMFKLTENKQVDLEFLSNIAARIYWGDGKYNDWLKGGIIHEYEEFGEYYVAICGDFDLLDFIIESVDFFELIWSLQ